MEGLQRYDYDDLAGIIRQDNLSLVETNGFREYYDAVMAQAVDPSISPGQRP